MNSDSAHKPGTDLFNSQFIRILCRFRWSATRSLFNPLAQNRIDLLHNTVSDVELATLYRPADEISFAFGNG